MKQQAGSNRESTFASRGGSAGRATGRPCDSFTQDEAHSGTETAKKAALELLEYCRTNQWAGYDPYDGLRSPYLDRLPFLQNRAGRLVVIQFMKRSMLNLRPLFAIGGDQNPKALALFASSLIRFLEIGLTQDEETARSVLKQLISKRTVLNGHTGWGYNFDWQNRTLLVPRFTPNIICTSFAGNALLDAYDAFRDASFLEQAKSAGGFIMKGLNITEGGAGICFSYTPLDKAQVHNANLLAAAFLARLFALTGEQELFDHAYEAVRFSAGSQAPDGSWPYGTNQKQKWIDNFHTGYNLVALHRFGRFTGREDFKKNIDRGFAFYRTHFFEEERIPKYYHDRLYPIDIHSIAQSIITLVELRECHSGNLDLARSVWEWACRNMKDKDGYFYYQKKKFYTNRISYMRWSQAWMLLALATFLKVSRRGKPQKSESGQSITRC